MCPPAIGSFARSGGGDGGSSGGEGLPADYSSAVPDDGPGSRVIRLFRPRFGETFEAEFVQNGSYNQAALEQFNHFCRDGGGAVGPMDPKVLDLCWTIWRKLNMTEPLSITSGYRSPVYNAGTKGAAKNSYHMKGCALDIQSSQRSPREIYAAAMAEAVGGVGRYNSFTHIDTRGYHTTWSG